MNFQKILINWYSIHKRDLPWRQTNDPYYIWLSEIMLQQTQVKQGLPYYERFVNLYPTIFDLANAKEEEVLKNWQGLGYYSRARNLHFTAKYVANELGGVFPDNYKQLVSLKGIGDYTASAIASIAFNEVKAVLDGNVFRVLSRYFGISEPINSTIGQSRFKELSQSLVVNHNPGNYNQALMEFGALQCKPTNPDCSICPLARSCKALKENAVSQLPIKLKKNKVQKKYFNYLVVLDPVGNTSLEKRTSKGIWQNLYQFPLVETPHAIDINDYQILLEKRSFVASTVVDIHLFNEKDIVHKLSHRHLYTKFWIVTLNDQIMNGIPLNELDKYPVPVLIANFINEFKTKSL
ncbi:A/G-specific adenine glycosylase [Winogradskyella aurantiaca]|uniref:A/G-specific adenine glycosylase n=1 Tax=Winogradskyella aurantiaca TaxID=2219558 RepID=UPI000E1C4B89|nr:A/G-specific adenine glycosylase [Winogradskyella aurantiaca]